MITQGLPWVGTRAALFAALLSCAFAAAVHADALSAGEELYLAECSKCHGQVAQSSGSAPAAALNPAGIRLASLQEPSLAFSLPYGPNLAGVLGRPAGSVPGYDYSKAFVRIMGGVVWDGATLDEFLSDTQLRVPGTRMYYAQPDASLRQEIIAYLATIGINAGNWLSPLAAAPGRAR